MSQKQVTALCLLDLSAAFDTIDHYIVLNRLSTWFGFDGKLISWPTYTCHGLWSLSTGLLLLSVLSVPQGPSLSSLLFIFYTAPLIVLYYLTHPSVTINLSFILLSSKMSQLQAADNLVSHWMSNNTLSLNQSETEFILIGLPAQLPKITDSNLLMSVI